MSTPDPVSGDDVYTVSRLNSELRAVVDGSFPLLWIGGEISGLSTPRSGHLYFGLKDAHAQIRCAMFKNRRMLLRFRPGEGDQVLMRARPSLYEPRGDLQLIVEHMEPAGAGELRRAFEALKAKLAQEGLFEPSRKRPLPAFPRRIGVITSPSGAAIRDVLQVLRRRLPSLPVLLYPVAVQGAEADAQIVAALRLAARRRDCDLLILTRGGGAPEDLAAFNDEAVARTIAELEIPLISAVGHEIDFTIADFVADRRAPTPSAAAEIATPDVDQLFGQLRRHEVQLSRAARGRLREGTTRVVHLRRRLLAQHPSVRLRQQQQRMDEFELRLGRASRHRVASGAAQTESLRRRLQAQSPRQQLGRLSARLCEDERRIKAAMGGRLQDARARLEALSRHLNAVSPLLVLARGYAVARRLDDKTIVRRVAQVKPGERVEILLDAGRLECRIDRCDPEPLSKRPGRR